MSFDELPTCTSIHTGSGRLLVARPALRLSSDDHRQLRQPERSLRSRWPDPADDGVQQSGAYRSDKTDYVKSPDLGAPGLARRRRTLWTRECRPDRRPVQERFLVACLLRPGGSGAAVRLGLWTGLLSRDPLRQHVGRPRGHQKSVRPGPQHPQVGEVVDHDVLTSL